MKGQRKAWIFTKNELRAIWVISILILILILSQFLVNHPVSEFSASEITKLDSVAMLLKENEEDVERIKLNLEPEPISFQFNPNFISPDSLILFGFSEDLILRFYNYRKALGAFRDKSQVLRIYGLSTQLIKKLDTSLVFQQTDQKSFRELPSRQNEEAVTEPQVEVENWMIDINVAQKEDFQKIKGIGNVLSDRIIKYRDLLGGFVRQDQLFEVYGLDPENIDLEKHVFIVDTVLVQKIRINKLSLAEIKAHPYINSYQAKLLVAYRVQHGFYTNLDDLAKSLAFKTGELQALKPYLDYK